MKSEERHRLEQNALADWLAQWITTIKPYLGTLLVVAIALAGIFGITYWWLQSSSQGTAVAWDRYYAALGSAKVTDLEQVSDDYPKTEVGQWAAVAASDLYLARGSGMLFENRVEAVNELRKAVDGYTTALEQSRLPGLRSQALYGRGRAYESLASTRQGGDAINKAVADYEQAIKISPDGAYAQASKERLESLKSPEEKKFYDKFAAHEPRSPVAEEPGTPGKRPSTELPEGPKDEFSGKVLSTTDLKAREGAKKPEPPKAESPKAEAPKAEPPTRTEPSKAEAPKAAIKPESKPESKPAPAKP